MTSEHTKRVLDIYNNQEKGYTSAKNIAKQARLSVNRTRKILEANSEVYARSQKPKKVSMIRWSAKHVGEILHADMFFIKKGPKSKAYDNPVLIAVDVYSRYIWLFPVKKKSSLIEPFKQILKDIKEAVQVEHVKVVTDWGPEFSKIKTVPGLEHIYSKSRHGAAIAEGNIARTRKVLAKITDKRKKIDFEAVAKNLNTVNKPASRKEEPYKVFWNGLEVEDVEQRESVGEKVFKVGDIVRRIDNDALGVFEKYSDRLPFSKTLYEVVERIMYQGKSKYRIREIGYVLKEEFRFYYPEELKLVDIEFLKKYA